MRPARSAASTELNFMRCIGTPSILCSPLDGRRAKRQLPLRSPRNRLDSTYLVGVAGFGDAGRGRWAVAAGADGAGAAMFGVVLLYSSTTACEMSVPGAQSTVRPPCCGG